jgi:hypothetical protein
VDDDEARTREVNKRLDEIVGARFDPDPAAGFLGRIRRGALKAIVAAVLAVAAAFLVVYTIESHRLPSPESVKAAKSGKPVDVMVLPPEAPSK